MLTKVSFTRDEWGHLLRLLNIMNLSMFSCCQFLSNRKHSVMSKRVQESTVKEGRQWRSRDLWIWHQRTSGVWRKILRKSWVTRTETRIGSELCFIQRQENDAKHQPKPNNVFSREATRWHSIFQPQETGARWGHPNRKVKDGTPQDANLRLSIPREGLQEPAEKLNFVEEAAAFGIEALMTNVLIWGLFLSTTLPFILDQITLKFWKSSWTFRRTSTFFPQYSEVAIASSSGDSECENDWMDSSFMCEIYTFSCSSDQVDESKSTCLLKFRLMLGECQIIQKRIEGAKIKLKNFDSPILTDQSSSSGIFPRPYVIGDPPEDPERLARSKHWTWEIWRSNHLHVNVQWHRMDKERKFRTMYFKFRTRQELREEILARTLDILSTWWWKEMVWNSQLYSYRKMGFHCHTSSSDSRNRVIQYSRASVLWIVEF